MIYKAVMRFIRSNHEDQITNSCIVIHLPIDFRNFGSSCMRKESNTRTESDEQKGKRKKKEREQNLRSVFHWPIIPLSMSSRQ